MPEIKVTQTYNIGVGRNITIAGLNYTFRHEDYWFTGHFEKAEANDITIKMYDDGTAQALVKATAYLTIVLNKNIISIKYILIDEGLQINSKTE